MKYFIEWHLGLVPDEFFGNDNLISNHREWFYERQRERFDRIWDFDTGCDEAFNHANSYYEHCQRLESQKIAEEEE